MNQVLCGKCEDVLKGIPANSVDSIVTDPPYGIKFMGKKWDYNVPSVEQWQEAFRVLKPGGYVLSFGGTRTYHRMVVNIEDAGFEIRDQIQWLYGSGFPKSLDISKAIDKGAGEKRIKGNKKKDFDKYNSPNYKKENAVEYVGRKTKEEVGYESLPATPEAQLWNGWGTALKPANEPICLARKPLSEKTVAENVLKWGTGGINIDECRIEAEPELAKNGDRLQSKSAEEGRNAMYSGLKAIDLRDRVPTGRFPANVIHDGSDEVVGLFPDTQSGAKHGIYNGWGHGREIYGDVKPYQQHCKASAGSAARFFYVAKASKAERGEGNTHPTVKPIKLIRYLIRLIVPPGGIVLDMFCGSGTTALAAIEEGMSYILIDKDHHNVDITNERIRLATRQTKIGEA